MAVLKELAQYDPNNKEPHIYFFAGGTDPAVQSKGHMGAMIRAIRAQYDKIGVPSMLTTENPKNVAAYQSRRWQFELVDTKDKLTGEKLAETLGIPNDNIPHFHFMTSRVPVSELTRLAPEPQDPR
jgi:hypothetical protein